MRFKGAQKSGEFFSVGPTPEGIRLKSISCFFLCVCKSARIDIFLKKLFTNVFLDGCE